MIRLQELNENTIYSIRKLFTHLIKTVFYHEHQLPCPKYLSVVRDLSFLPKLIGVSEVPLERAPTLPGRRAPLSDS